MSEGSIGQSNPEQKKIYRIRHTLLG
ncbi:hypothetical protein MWU32_00230 [Gelidibacter sp. F63206]|nr:hypothetical protein [Gelidibacter sp. F63206]